MRRLGLVVLSIVAIGLLTACDDDGSGSSITSPGEETAAAQTATAGSFDPSVLTGVALQPDDVPAGLAFHGNYTAGPLRTGVLYTAEYSGDGISVSSSIGHHTEPGDRRDTIRRMRAIVTGLIRNETNLTLPGADQAFSYSNPQSLSVATVATVGDFYVNIVVTTTDSARIAEIRDQEKLERYTRLVFDRLVRYLKDPASVTPVPSAPQFSPESGLATG
jgi:hypothetical protein